MRQHAGVRGAAGVSEGSQAVQSEQNRSLRVQGSWLQRLADHTMAGVSIPAQLAMVAEMHGATSVPPGRNGHRLYSVSLPTFRI